MEIKRTGVYGGRFGNSPKFSLGERAGRVGDVRSEHILKISSYRIGNK